MRVRAETVAVRGLCPDPGRVPTSKIQQGAGTVRVGIPPDTDLDRRPDRAGFRALPLILALAGLFGLATASEAPASVSYVTQWGTHGSGDGEFVGPVDLATGPSGDVFVSDTFDNGKGNAAQRFSSDGSFLTGWGSPAPVIHPPGNGQFESPGGIATDPSGNVYVGDYLLNRIQKFSPDGVFLLAWGTTGTTKGKFYGPQGIATDSSGNVFVVDYGNVRIQKFDSSGNFLDKWGSFGSGEGQFLSPSFIATDPSGKVYVADSGNSRIQRFSPDGIFLTEWDSPGPGVGVPDYPQGIATNPAGKVYVVGTNSIQKYSSTGALITRWGSNGSGDGQFRSPQGIAADSSGNVYVGDSGNSRIQKFNDSGPPYPDPGAARLKVPKPDPVTIRAGGTGKLTVKVKNTGSSAAKKVRVCAPLSGKARKALKKIDCVKLGSIQAGKQKKAKLRIGTKCVAATRIQLDLKATAANAETAKSKATIRIKRCSGIGHGPRPTGGRG
jgi:sugar lactone lactonase YvrE